MIEIRKTETFATWIDELQDIRARARILVRIERLAVGKIPACVEVSKGALTFGDLGDPKSNVRELLSSNFTIRRKPALGAGPSVFYIV